MFRDHHHHREDGDDEDGQDQDEEDEEDVECGLFEAHSVDDNFEDTPIFGNNFKEYELIFPFILFLR